MATLPLHPIRMVIKLRFPVIVWCVLSATAAPVMAQLCPGSPPSAALPAQPADAPRALWALVEIPAGSAVKYELHPETGRMEVDRFLAMSMVYPANYGILPCTLAEDGDPLDVLVLTRKPVAPGALIRVRPVGLLRMDDGGETDDKVLAVPSTSVDPAFEPLRGLDDIPIAELLRIQEFFRTYKRLPEPSGDVLVGPWEDLDEALPTIQRSLMPAGGGQPSP